MISDQQRTYIAIDLKSFYASVECVERGLDPLTSHLVVADTSRTEKTICLAVSPSLKAYGVGGRARLFEVIEAVKQINEERRKKAPGRVLRGSSVHQEELAKDPSLALNYVTAVPKMYHYMEVSAHIYELYLKYIAPEDIHVYSIDEVFIDATKYLKLYNISAHDLTMKLIHEVLDTTGITATAGIGPNMYLCKIAMDVEAKHIPADKDGVRIAELTEQSYREKLWDHMPLTDFWRVGRGIAGKLESFGMFTMGDVARCSLKNEDLLYSLFGINAELLIDHAWGYEPCTMEMIKSYRPESSSLSSGQVLSRPYAFEEAKVVAREMIDRLVLDMVTKELVTDQIVLAIGYDKDSLNIPDMNLTDVSISQDYYGQTVPKSAHGSINLGEWTSSSLLITRKAMELFDRIVSKDLLIRRMYVVASRVRSEKEAAMEEQAPEQLDLFEDPEQKEKNQKEKEKEKRRQEAILSIRQRFGDNAVLMGTDFLDGATQKERNEQIGGHKK